jgi:hypothetical protein
MRYDQAEDIAKDQVVRALQKLQKSDQGGKCVTEAIDYIAKRWDSELKRRVQARRQLVKIVKTFLFSERFATEVRGEVEIAGGATEKEGYTLRQAILESRSIRNPLRFIELYTAAASANFSQSAWMFYMLAFCIDRNGK